MPSENAHPKKADPREDQSPGTGAWIEPRPPHQKFPTAPCRETVTEKDAEKLKRRLVAAPKQS